MPKIIKFIQLTLHCFTNHKSLTVDYGDITKLSGMNGVGKTSIGSGPAWILYGTDLLGKTWNPSPSNYEYDKVFASLLLSVDGNQVLLAREIDGDNKFYINEVPTKAKEYEAYVASLFDKELFLSLYYPPFYFSQHKDKQRDQLLKYVTAPANSEVFAEMSRTKKDQKIKDIVHNPQASELATVLKKHSISQLETLHKDLKLKNEKLHVQSQGSVKTLTEQVKELGEAVVIDREAIQAKIDANQKKVDAFDVEQKKIDDRKAEIKDKELWIKQLDDKVTEARTNKANAEAELVTFTAKELESDCDTCGQPLTEDARKKSEETKQGEITRKQSAIELIREKGNTALSGKKLAKEELTALQPLPELTYTVTDLLTENVALNDQLKSDENRTNLTTKLAKAKQDEIDYLKTKNDSIFLLDAIKAFKATEAQIQTVKIQELFTTLSIRLFKYVKSNDEWVSDYMIQMDGKDFTSLSDGEKIAAGLELTDVLFKQSELITPVFIDGIGEYTGKIAVYDQLITGRAVEGEPLKINGKEPNQ